MWPFDRKPTKPPVPGAVDAQELAALARRLDATERRLEEAEKKVEELDLDWSESYDKFRRLYARIAKRQERDEAAEGKTNAQDDAGRTIDIAPVSGGPVPRARRNY